MQPTRIARAGRPRPLAGGPGGEAGLSLLEVLFAGLLVASVAVFLAPLFVRAVAANTQGGEASEAANHTKSFLELSLGVPMNHERYRMDGSGSGGTVTPPPPTTSACPGNAATDPSRFRRVADMVYDTGPRAPAGFDQYFGDERWRPVGAGGVDDDPDPRLRWDGTVDVRVYNYFDLLGGLPSATDPSQLYTDAAGIPYVLDCPLSADVAGPLQHFKEYTTDITGRREGSFVGSGQRMETVRVRTY